MLILAINTCNNRLSVSLSDNETLIDHSEEFKSDQASELLISTINSLLQQHNLTYSNIDRIAVATGPGSFTGVRIGVSAAKGLHIASNIALCGITTLRAIAEQACDSRNPILVAMDARRDQCYVQAFDANLVPLCKAFLADYSIATDDYFNNSPYILARSGINLIKTKNTNIALRNEIAFPSAYYIALASLRDHQINSFTSLNAEPFYVRPPDAKISSKKTYTTAHQ